MHPAGRRPQDIALAAMVILGSAWVILVTLQSALLAVIAVAILLASIAPFLLPTTYTLDDDGITERRGFVTRKRAWTAIRRLEIGARRAFASPYRERRVLERYRGIAIVFPDDPAAAIAILRAHQ